MLPFKVEVKWTLNLLLLLIPIFPASGRNLSRKTYTKRTPDDSWVVIDHGLMLSHYQSRMKSVNGNPIVSRRNSDVPLFSSSISGLTSSSEDFKSWDEDLVTELSEAPFPRKASSPSIISRDVATRTGLVHLTRDSTGGDHFTIETVNVSSKSLSLSTRSSFVLLSPKRMEKRFLHLKRSAKGKTKQLDSLITKEKNSLDIMKGATIPTKITWYTGQDLLNPFCAQKSGWTPRDDSLIIAVTQVWEMRPKCGDFMELVVVDKHVGQVGKSVIARVVDLCGGCAPEVPHADLSKAAFTRLFNLDVGVVSGLAMRKVPPPKKWDNNLYGPRTL